jgi:hypothetical protein
MQARADISRGTEQQPRAPFVPERDGCGEKHDLYDARGRFVRKDHSSRHLFDAYFTLQQYKRAHDRPVPLRSGGINPASNARSADTGEVD